MCPFNQRGWYQADLCRRSWCRKKESRYILYEVWWTWRCKQIYSKCLNVLYSKNSAALGGGWSEQSSVASIEECFPVLFSQVSGIEKLLCHDTGEKCCGICRMVEPSVSVFCNFLADFPLTGCCCLMWSLHTLMWSLLTSLQASLSQHGSWCGRSLCDFVGLSSSTWKSCGGFWRWPSAPALRGLTMTNCSTVSLSRLVSPSQGSKWPCIP